MFSLINMKDIEKLPRNKSQGRVYTMALSSGEPATPYRKWQEAWTASQGRKNRVTCCRVAS